MDPNLPTSTSDLLFPLSAQNFSTTLSAVKRSTLSTSNRLHSIYKDSRFVEQAAEVYGFPLIANERCGSWYIPPERKASSVYFKSTDGHSGQWAFSTRRLNLHLLGITGEAGGLLFPHERGVHELCTPKNVVCESEHTQIEARMNGFLENVSSLGLDISALRSSLKKPLRPYWITRDSSDMNVSSLQSVHNYILCCTASQRIFDAEGSGDGYIQGAGDDSEGWAYGLTPTIFWTHREKLLTAERDLPDLIRRYTAIEKETAIAPNYGVRIGPTSLYIGCTDAVPKDQQSSSFDGIIDCGQIACNVPYVSPIGAATSLMRPKLLHLRCCSGKLGSRALRTQLPLIMPFIQAIARTNPRPSLLITCTTGKDISVGVALAILCYFYDSQHQFKLQPTEEALNKTLIRRRLALITLSKPDVNPSRATLQSVHSFLMPISGQSPTRSPSHLRTQEPISTPPASILPR
ncbi:MAG: hypothetical protein Q9217_000830 [Psora testacea]